MDDKLSNDLSSFIEGDVANDSETLTQYSHDASLFELKPQIVVFPKNEKDVEKVVSYVAEHKKENPKLSITGRSAGTDMAGGSINESIILAFSKYFNKTPQLNGNIATTQPGVFYRDFEAKTLKSNLIFPSYPASREICAMGGIVNNNSGGEKSLQYGKTEKYVKRVKVVLRDGKTYEFKPLTMPQLEKKIAQKDLDGEIYRKMFHLIDNNYDEIMKAKPQVSKNSAGYFLWNVYDKENGVFDLTKLWVGAQGTLGMLLEADIELVPVHTHREMMIIFLYDLKLLQQIIEAVMPLGPESFESYDDNTLKLALKYFPEFAKFFGASGIVKSGIAFLPEFFMTLTGGLPKLVLQVDFTGDNQEDLKEKIAILKAKLARFHPKTRVAVDDQEKKYWLIRRESFNLLRGKIRGKHTAPFIDDFTIRPEFIAEVIPQINKIVGRHKEFIYTVAGHVGDGNFHIIPLVDIKKKSVRRAIPEISKEVYDIVLKYDGSITAEHNDGLARSPYLRKMYGEKIYELFKKTKEIFDPEDIFNPKKKIGPASLDFAMDHLRQNW